MFLGSKHCQHCGATASREDDVVAPGRRCPRCRSELQVVFIGDAKVLECATCSGLWLNTATFESICASREQQSVVLGNATLIGNNQVASEESVRYVPCPECSQLMNRANFARCSGVIIDLCRNHGIWFDHDELGRIIEFIRDGGLERSRAKEKASLEEDRRELERERLSTAMRESGQYESPLNKKLAGIVSVRDLVVFLLNR